MGETQREREKEEVFKGFSLLLRTFCKSSVVERTSGKAIFWVTSSWIDGASQFRVTDNWLAGIP